MWNSSLQSNLDKLVHTTIIAQSNNKCLLEKNTLHTLTKFHKPTPPHLSPAASRSCEVVGCTATENIRCLVALHTRVSVSRNLESSFRYLLATGTSQTIQQTYTGHLRYIIQYMYIHTYIYVLCTWCTHTYVYNYIIQHMYSTYICICCKHPHCLPTHPIQCNDSAKQCSHRMDRKHLNKTNYKDKVNS